MRLRCSRQSVRRRPAAITAATAVAVACIAPIAFASDRSAVDAAEQALAHLTGLAEHRAPDAAAAREQTDAALEALDRYARRLRAEADGSAIGNGRRTPGEDGQRTAELRAARAGAMFLRGELNRRLAALLPADDPERAARAEAALDAFRDLRLTYKDLAIGALGYIGEARTALLQNRPEDALAVLEPVLSQRNRVRDEATAQVFRLAVLEQVEALLAVDRDEAIETVRGTRGDALFRDNPAWAARLDWLLARALLAPLGDQAPGSAGEPDTELPPRVFDEAAKLLRNDAVIESAPALRRLSLLERLTRTSADHAMTRGERLAHARALAGFGYIDAALTRLEALADEATPLSTDDVLLLGTLRHEAGRMLEAAEAFEAVLTRDDADESDRRRALRGHAAALDAALHEQSPADPVLAERTRRAYAAIVDSVGDAETAASALARWWSLARGSVPPRQVLARLTSHAELVESDRFLAYAQLATRRDVLQRRTRSSDPSGPDPVREAEARRLVDDLRAFMEAAAPSEEPALAGHAALLTARVLADEPIDRPGEALSELRRRRAWWEAEAPLRRAAVSLEATLLMRLGLIDEAERLVTAAHQRDASSSLLLHIAEALGERYAESSPSARAALRDRVRRLTGAAITAALDGASDYPWTTVAAAEAMIRVEAWSDALRMLEPLEREAGDALDPGTRLTASLLRGRALHGRGDAEDALLLLRDLAEEHAGVPRVQMALAEALSGAGEAEAALERYRRAREAAAPGSAAWWRATRAVATHLADAGQSSQAEHLLRVALLLHPAEDADAARRDAERAYDALVARSDDLTERPADAPDPEDATP